ncbi:uncharacterized methyltransferase At1g78140, chloroplastic-like [Rutidosis leptorrhynchoides]|uniref:uncharacterized methyltransferase At1g78140, chloroplastic-like n=1 Tax=Rutidosis leptorrhynchoides TaxID=125765 RepID=UPI003A99F6B2
MAAGNTSAVGPVARRRSTLFADFNEKEDAMGKKQILLACPICHDKLIWNGDSVLSEDSTPRFMLKCSTCKVNYKGNKTYLDLTASRGSNKYGEWKINQHKLFRFPILSFLYERGWRQYFSIIGGFPGPQKEFELMREYLKPVIGGSIIDASCGSGMFTRLFAKSGLFSRVVGLDFSVSMLKQCYDYINREENISKENLILVRADIALLPFSASSIVVVHAGAALHAWPSPSAGVSEISRILRPGGVFAATTFILDGPLSFIPISWLLTQIIGSHFYRSDRELQELCSNCGLVDYTCIRNRGIVGFVMISARKPN